MASMIKLFSIGICFLGLVLNLQDNKIKALAINWIAYEINPVKVEGTFGQVLLTESENGQIYNPLNLLLLKNSEYLFDKPGDYNLTSEKALKGIFGKDKPIADMQTEVEREINTQIFFCHAEILSYKIKLDYKGDKLSPYIEFLNIDLAKNKLISAYDFIDSAKSDQVNKVLQDYENTHKKEIIKNYQHILSERADQLLSEEQDVFLKPQYTFEKALIKKTRKINLVNMQKKGMEISVDVNDRNFKKYKNGNQYSSFVFIPYKSIRPYLNTKASLYKTITELSGAN